MPSGSQTLRDTTREDGGLVEWFVHTPETVDHFLVEKDRRGLMAHVYGYGLVLADRDGEAERIQSRAPARCSMRDLCELRGAWVDGHPHLARTGAASALLAAVELVLDEAGGELREGFRRVAAV